MFKVNHFSKSYWGLCYCYIFMWNLVWISCSVGELSRFVRIFDELFWIFEHFVTQKVHFWTRSSKPRKICWITNCKVLPFIWWKQNENWIFFSKVVSIFVKQTTFHQFYWPIWKMLTSVKNTVISKSMGIDFESFYAALLVCQVSLLAFIKLILEGRDGQYGSKNLVLRSKILVFLLRNLVFRLKYLFKKLNFSNWKPRFFKLKNQGF